MAKYELNAVEIQNSSLRKLKWQAGAGNKLGTLVLTLDQQDLAHGLSMEKISSAPVAQSDHMHMFASIGLQRVEKIFQARMREKCVASEICFIDALRNWKCEYNTRRGLAQIHVDLMQVEDGPTREEFLRQFEERNGRQGPYRCFVEQRILDKFQNKINDELKPDGGLDAEAPSDAPHATQGGADNSLVEEFPKYKFVTAYANKNGSMQVSR